MNPARLFRSDFAPEWGAALALVLADLLLSLHAGVHFQFTPGAYWIVPPLLAAAALARRHGHRRIVLLLDYFALLIVTDTAVRVATYAASAMGGTLWDARLMAADRALGFDWLAYFHFVVEHPQIGAPLGFLYYRIGLFAIGFFVLMSATGNTTRMRETYWLLFVASLLTTLGAAAMPVLGPYHTYGLEGCCGHFVQELERLRSGSPAAYPLGGLQGVIQCPSFHTTLALALMYAFRGTGRIGATVNILNVLILLAVPVFGGHYVMDMIAGAGVMLASLAIVRGFAKWKASAASASPVSAAAFADAC
jgi:hypothetical protein